MIATAVLPRSFRKKQDVTVLKEIGSIVIFVDLAGGLRNYSPLKRCLFLVLTCQL